MPSGKKFYVATDREKPIGTVLPFNEDLMYVLIRNSGPIELEQIGAHYWFSPDIQETLLATLGWLLGHGWIREINQPTAILYALRG